MSDRSCIYCEDRGDCSRCSYFFEKDKPHSKCKHLWKDHEVKTQPDRNRFYPPWAVCPRVEAELAVVEDGTPR